MKKSAVVFIVAGIVFLSLVLLAIYLYQHSQTNDQLHRDRIALIRDIQLKTADLTRNVVLVEQGQISHFDEVTKTQIKIDVLMTALADDNHVTDDLLETWGLLKNNVENIKSAVAVFRNSVLYFPKGAENLYEKFADDKEQKNFISELVILQCLVMQFSKGHLNGTDSGLLEQIKKFNQATGALPKQAVFEASMLARHAGILINKQLLLQQLHSQLLDTKMLHLTQLSLNQYNQDFQNQLR